MTLYLTLFFDPHGEQAIRALWQRLAHDGIPIAGLHGHRPHLTLAAYESHDLAAYQADLQHFTTNRDPLPLRFHTLGLDPALGQLFLAPQVTHELLALHEDLHAFLLSPTRPPKFDNLRPAHWNPHCTLATGLPPDQLPAALAAAIRHFHPFHVTAEGIGILPVPSPMPADASQHRFGGPAFDPTPPHPRPTSP